MTRTAALVGLNGLGLALVGIAVGGYINRSNEVMHEELRLLRAGDLPGPYEGTLNGHPDTWLYWANPVHWRWGANGVKDFVFPRHGRVSNVAGTTGVPLTDR